MRIKPAFAFDICWEVYKGAREVLETKRGVSALDLADARKFLWKPDIRPRLNEYVADFALAGQAALREPRFASRLVLFRVFYLGLAEYDRAREFFGVTEWTWSQWTEEVRGRCGKEILRRGLFPPRRYFQEST